LSAADEAATLSAAAAVQDRGVTAAAQATVGSPPAAPDSQTDSIQHSGTSSSKGFGVTVEQLRQLVQAGVDDSQADAAAGVMQALAQRLQERRARKQRKHSEAAPDGGSVGSGSSSLGSGVHPPVGNGASPSSTTNGTTAPVSSSSSSSKSMLAQLPRSLASALGSSLSSGLPGTSADTAARVAAFGSNSLAAAATSSFWQLLLEAASDSTLLLLMAAGAVSLGLAASTGKEAVDYIDGAAILASVAICVTVTAVTNYQKEAKFRQLNSLKENIPVSGWLAGGCLLWGCVCGAVLVYVRQCSVLQQG
jgi:magnesium-transporting ATPase (P-type)